MTTELISFTAGAGVSADNVISTEFYHTVFPVFREGAGKVLVQVKDSDNSYRTIGFLSTNPLSAKTFEIHGDLTYRVKVRNAGADFVETPNAGGGSLPAGGTAGQALRKLSSTDGDADWSPYWVVDPATGAITHTTASVLMGGPPDYGQAAPFGVAPDFLAVGARSTTSDYGAFDVDLKVDRTANFSLTATCSGYSMPASAQNAFISFQAGSGLQQLGTYFSTQFGQTNTQSANSSFQAGSNNSQSGYSSNFQAGGSNVQSGGANKFQCGYGNTQTSASASFQSGMTSTQSGNYGFQSGGSLNDGGFNHTTMFGTSKTATVGKRAYFALDNGIWLKPVAGDAASPENGTICYNATTHKFRGYADGAWVDFH